MSVPETIRIVYSYNESGRLWAASSPDFKGLHVIDSSRERVIDRLPEVATELAKAMGHDVAYCWEREEPAAKVPGFHSMPNELIAATAPC